MIAKSKQAQPVETAERIRGLVARRAELIGQVQEHAALTGTAPADLVAQVDQTNRDLMTALDGVARRAWGLTWDWFLSGTTLKVESRRPEQVALADEWDAVQARRGSDRRAVRA